MKWRRIAAGDYRAVDGGYSLCVVRADSGAWHANVRAGSATYGSIATYLCLADAKVAAEAVAKVLHEAPLRTPEGWRRVR